MSKDEFFRRWGSFSYDRIRHQGKTVSVSLGDVVTTRRVFGRNGIGRFAAFCFGSRNRPDFAVLPDGTAGLYSYPEFDEEGAEIGPSKLVIVELKTPDVPIDDSEKGQCWKYLDQPEEQLGGVQGTLSTYLEFFLNPEISEVFCANEPTFSVSEIDAGKIVCLAMPQKFQSERLYINTILKLSYYFHSLSRFDKPAEEREKDNLVILFADEGQEIITGTESACRSPGGRCDP